VRGIQLISKGFIRKALPEDEAAVFALAREFATSFAVDAAGFSVAYSQVLSLPDMYLGVALSADTIIGYVLGTAHPAFFASGHVAWVEEIMVREEFRSNGIGKMLMEDFERWAASKNCRVIALATRRTAKFYISLGYAESATYFRKIVKDS
jgi:GNAT superfamily N-acetyltransferase